MIVDQWLITTALIFGAGSSFMAFVVAAFGAWRAMRGEAVSKENKVAIQQLEVRVDGRLTQVLELSEKLAFKSGADEQRVIGEDKASALAAGQLASAAAQLLVDKQHVGTQTVQTQIVEKKP